MPYGLVPFRAASAKTLAVAIMLVTLVVGPLGAWPAGRAAPAQPSLRQTLHERIKSAQRVPYAHATLVDVWDVLSLADEDPARPGHVLTIYGNASFPAASTANGAWEREHLWPRSRGTGDTSACGFPHNDLHHLFPSEPDLNQSRGNLPFDDCAAPDCAVKGAGNRMRGGDDGAWEVWPGRRGDVARAILYMDVRYEGGVNTITGCSEPDLVVTDTREALITVPEVAPTGAMGILATLLRWHAEDPVDDGERRRNEVVERYQRNRNPFVDEPDLACRLWPCPSRSPTPPPPTTPTQSPPAPSATAVASTASPSASATRDSGGDPSTPAPPLRPRAFLALALRMAAPPNAVATATSAPTSTPSPTPTATLDPTAALPPSPTPTVVRPTEPPVSPTPAAGGGLRIAAMQCAARDETVFVRNDGGAAIELEGWILRSVVGDQTFAFPRYALAPGDEVTVHSGPDAPPTSGSALRWTTAYIWNNDGDEAELRAPDGRVVDDRDC